MNFDLSRTEANAIRRMVLDKRYELEDTQYELATGLQRGNYGGSQRDVAETRLKEVRMMLVTIRALESKLGDFDYSTVPDVPPP